MHFFSKHITLTVFIIGLIVSVPLLFPYLHSGYFPTHDGEWAVVRLTDMYRELKDFQFPARYSGNLNFGYGYPLFEFAYPLPYYLGFIIHVFHIPFVWSMKLLFALSVPASFLSMYLLGKKIWKLPLAGILMGVLYVYFPYRLVDLFVRGSIGESLSLAIFPLILYFILCLQETKKMIFAVAAGIGFAALITTHNIMVVEFAPVMFLFAIVSIFIDTKNRFQLTKGYLLTFFLGIGLSCFFWLPALSEEHLIALSMTPIADRSLYFVQPLQLLLPSWGYGTRDFSYQLGIPQLLVIIALVVFFILEKKKKFALTFQNTLVLSLIGLLGLYTFLLFPISDVVWRIVPLFKEINYPWTLLAVMGCLISIVAGGLIATFKGRIALIILCIFAVVYAIQYAHPSNYVDRGDAFYLTNDATTTSSDEYMPLWVQAKPTERSTQKFILLSGNGTFSNDVSTSKKLSADLRLISTGTLQINTIYYPGWHVLIDGREATIAYDNPKGLMNVHVPVGEHHIEAVFEETPLRLLSDIISIGSIVVVFCIMTLYWKGKYAKK